MLCLVSKTQTDELKFGVLMGARNLFLLEPHSSAPCFLSRFPSSDMLRVVGSFWVLLRSFFLWALGSASRHIFRIQHAGDEGSDRNEKSCHFYDLWQENHELAGCLKEGAEPDDWTSEDSEKDNDHDHQSFDGDEEGESVLLGTSTSNYQFSFANNISLYVQEPKVLSFTVQELFVGSVDPTDLSPCDFSDQAIPSSDEVCEAELVDGSGVVETAEQAEEIVSSENDELVSDEEELLKGRISPENSAPQVELELVSVDSDEELYMNSDKVDSFAVEAVVEAEDKAGSFTHKELLSGNFWGFDEGIVEEVEEEASSEESYMWEEEDEVDLADPGHGLASSIRGQLDESDLDDDIDEYIEMELREAIPLAENHDEIGQAEFDDQDDLDSMWEHDEIIEQLRMELKAARTGGLPTILEESESEEKSETSPVKMADEPMKPLKITDQKVEHKDRVMDIQKVYKGYAERMRKLDVLNSQTMHAIGLAHLTDPLKSDATPAGKPVLPQGLFPFKLRRSKIGPTAKSMEALYGDLEMVYVGQVCLSWEILQWQYGKSRELVESDPHGYRRYNFVAGELQLLQVLLRRFIEDEPFQGPRIENYVKNRCVLRKLLQVPALRDDSFGQKKARVGMEDAVTNAALMEIIEESIRLFWDFVRFDKEEADVVHRACRKIQFNLLDSTDLELLIAVRNQLEKKERRLKDIARSGNCIVKRFQKQRDRADQTLLLVVAQVEVRLISRVLNAAKVTREQVLWCHEKLDRINFVSRKIYVDPSFSLFPC